MKVHHGLILKQLRTVLGVTQKNLADEIKYSQSYLSNVENSEETPNKGFLKKYIAGLHSLSSEKFEPDILMSMYSNACALIDHNLISDFESYWDLDGEEINKLNQEMDLMDDPTDRIIVIKDYLDRLTIEGCDKLLDYLELLERAGYTEKEGE